jgi:hypothetical protein
MTLIAFLKTGFRFKKVEYEAESCATGIVYLIQYVFRSGKY